MTIPARMLLDAVHLVKAKLARLPAPDQQDRRARDAAVQQICNELVAVGAVVGERHDGHFIRFCRLRASSTGGRHAALTNWVEAAYRQLDRENA